MNQRLRAALACAALMSSARAQSAAELLRKELRGLPSVVIPSAVGITRHGTPIPCLITADDLDYQTAKVRVLLVGGLDGSPSSVESVTAAVRWFYGPHAYSYRKKFAVSAVPAANPDGWALGTRGANASGGDPTRGYPPKGEAYGSATDPEAAYLWRWIGMHAPDLVIDVRAYGALGWHVPKSQPALARLRPIEALAASDELAAALNSGAPAGTGAIPAVKYVVGASPQTEYLRDLLKALNRFRGPSPARAAIQARLRRTPLEMAEQLAAHYGHEFDQAVYIPAMALVGRLRLGELTKEVRQQADVERLAEPYRSGARPSLEKPTASHLAGHLIFGELARLTGKPRYAELVRAAAALASDPALYSEMSDGVFMGCPILAQAGRLTGEARYFDMCVRQMRFMRELDLRGDGLYRHSPLDASAWGRGNAFPALGLALSLTDLPADHPGRAEMLGAWRAHLTELARYQDPTGMWHQVIDVPASYRELSATSMIAFAIARGLRMGWLEREKFAPVLERAWSAVKARVSPDGELVDVCTGTGKQKSLREYLDRTAILGKDARGGAMALLLATEMALLGGG